VDWSFRATAGRSTPAILNAARIEQARKALYEPGSLRVCDDEVRQRCFIRNGERFQLKDRYRKGVNFFQANLAAPTVGLGRAGYDVILCRNMLIYFHDDAFISLIGHFSRLLLPGGYLLLGHSESLVDRMPTLRAGVPQWDHGLPPNRRMLVIRVFVVDDSAFIRKALTRVLSAQPECQVVGEAANGHEALERIPAANPDVVTLDVAMHGMDGLATLRALLGWRPSLHVIMLSAHTREGAAATLEALTLGAADFIDKTAINLMDLDGLGRELVDRLQSWRPGSREARPAVRRPAATVPAVDLSHCELCVIGASTGGPCCIAVHP
jgi:CheY-like chemotaxis protein